MSHSSDLWLVLGFPAEPVPGDPGVVRSYAAEYAKVAQSIADASTRLRSIADKQDSESKFVSEFRGEAIKVADKIAKAHKRYDGVAIAVANYAGPLEDAQSRADAALRMAQSAYDSHQSNNLLVQKYENELAYNSSLSDQEKQHYTQLLHHAIAQVNENQAGINHAKALLQSAIDSRDDAAIRTAGQIENVENTGGLNDSGWTQWWDANGAWIDTAVTVLEVVGAIALIVIAFIPGLDVVEALIIGGIALAAVLNASFQASAGTKSWGEAALEIGLALIPCGGAVAAKLAVKTVIREAVSTGVTSAAARGFIGFSRSVVAKPIEEEAAKALSVSGKNIAKAIFTNGADTMEQMQNVAKMSLTAAGRSERIAGVVEQQAWKVNGFFGPLPSLVTEHVVEKLAEPFLDRLSGKSD